MSSVDKIYSLILGNCLKFCVENRGEQKLAKFSLNQLKSYEYLKCYTLNEIYTVLKKANQFFEINIEDNDDILVKVVIKLRLCKDYNSKHKSCKLGNSNECNYLHLCENELKSIFGCHQANTCKLNHTFDTYFILNVLNKFKIEIDPNLLCDFYKVI
jgi:hypothetical protein